RPHYARTLRQWVARLESNWDEAVAAAGEAIARTWRLYMAAAATGFEASRLDVHQQLLTLPGTEVGA
ncbi:MAG: class I SAM-dependent methyltransferase, partial [Candidatus Limnocylindria bacterium]